MEQRGLAEGISEWAPRRPALVLALIKRFPTVASSRRTAGWR